MPATSYLELVSVRGERCGTRAKGDGLYVVVMRPNKRLTSNVAIRSRMIKLYPTPNSATILKAVVLGGPPRPRRHRLHIPRKAPREEVTSQAHIRVERRLYKKEMYVGRDAPVLQIRDNAIGDCVVAR